MNHRHFRLVRNVFFIIVALTMAGYPYLIYSGYIFNDPQEYLIRGGIAFAVLLMSFLVVALFSEREYERLQKEKEERDIN